MIILPPRRLSTLCPNRPTINSRIEIINYCCATFVNDTREHYFARCDDGVLPTRNERHTRVKRRRRPSFGTVSRGPWRAVARDVRGKRPCHRRRFFLAFSLQLSTCTRAAAANGGGPVVQTVWLTLQVRPDRTPPSGHRRRRRRGNPASRKTEKEKKTNKQTDQ